MKKLFAVYLLMGQMGGKALAQDYPEKDDAGATIYYKIFSAAPGNTGLCLQDNSKENGKYAYPLAEHENDNKFQEWQFVPGDAPGTYLLRNRATYRYISTTGDWIGTFFAITFATKKTYDNEILFTPLGDGQMTMTYKEGMTTRYMLVGDTGKGPDIFNTTDHYNSSRAWYVFPVGSVPVSVAEVKQGTVSILAINRRIVVSGTNQYRICDIQGRQVDPDSELLPGIYVVEAAGEVKNVLVR